MFSFSYEYNYDIILIGCENMRVIISAGGTGGHIYPALAIINKIKEREPDSEFLYIGTHNRMEKEIVPKYGIPFETIEIYGFYRKQIWKNFKTLKCFWNGYSKCKKMIKQFKPDVVIGVGGYVTGPVLYAAHKCGIKTFIHEQNSVPGVSNLFLSKFVTKIGVSFKSSMKEFPEYKTIFTGNPCSENALKAKPVDKKTLGLSPNKKLVLFVMGSLGSTKVNERLERTMSLFNGKDYEILYVTGKESWEEMKKKKFPKNVKLVPYIDGLSGVMKVTDVMVSRAGASTLSEIIALKIPSILIPSPYVPNNHQFKNAMDLVEKNAAILIEEKDLKGDIIVRNIDSLFHDSKKVSEMKRNLTELSVPNSAEKIYNILKEMVNLK